MRQQQNNQTAVYNDDLNTRFYNWNNKQNNLGHEDYLNHIEEFLKGCKFE
jgi:hypothetical protein